MRVCPKCDTELNDDLVFCTRCGTKLPLPVSKDDGEPVSLQGEVYCPTCEETYTDGSLFCRKCGAKLEPVPEPVFLYKQCPGCSKRFEDDSVFCNMCGIRLIDVYDSNVDADLGVFICPSCKKEFNDGALFCTDCGIKLEPLNKSIGTFRKKNESSSSHLTSKTYCEKCGRPIYEGQDKCSGCNSPIDASNIVTFKIPDE